MAVRQPLVLDTSGQVEQIPSGDYIGHWRLNVGPPSVKVVTSSSITIQSSSVRLNAPSAVNLDQISNGNDGDIAIFRGSGGMSPITIRKGVSNIYGGPNRVISSPTDILVLLNVANSSWVEISYQG